MSLPHLETRKQPVPRQRGVSSRPEADWSYTASSEPNDRDNALVVFRLSMVSLGIDDLTAEVAARSGAAEARRWRRARAQEYVVRLRDQLRLHLPQAEIIVHADEGSDNNRLQVITTILTADPHDAARSEEEIADRVQAISKQAWISWSEGLHLTMATLRDLECAS